MMMRLLNGTELAEFIKERQAHQVTVLNKNHKINPKLAIVVTVDNPIIEIYMKLKTKYGRDIGVEVDVHRVKQTDIKQVLQSLNTDGLIHGIIIQLPLENPDETEQSVNLVDPSKDVDALGAKAQFEPATPMAILWLLSGYNIALEGKQILLVGRGKLVGAPLEKILKDSNYDVEVADRSTKDLNASCLNADILITATGVPGIITSAMLKPGAVVVDAGVASENGRTVGDVADDVYKRADLTITPQKGGVGPLTVTALFENVIRAASRSF